MRVILCDWQKYLPQILLCSPYKEEVIILLYNETLSDNIFISFKPRSCLVVNHIFQETHLHF